MENDNEKLKIAISKKKAQLEECTLIADKSRDKYLKAQRIGKKVKNELDKIRNEKLKLKNEGECEF